MNILLIECTRKIVEFAFSKSNEIVILKELDSESNADSLIYTIKQEFEKSPFDFKSIKAVSLSNGPGSFTGLRIGSAIAKGICFSLGARLLEISTLDILANKYEPLDSKESFMPLIFSNSKTLEFYTAVYRKENVKLLRISDYEIKKFEAFSESENTFILNDKTDFSFPGNFKFVDVSSESNMLSQHSLTMEYIREN